MTTSIFAIRKEYQLSLPKLVARVKMRFFEMNKKGRITTVLMGIIAVSAASYLTAMAALFHMGLRIQGSVHTVERLKQDILYDEIALQQDDANFVVIHKDTLQSMEKISSITYLTLDKVTVLAPASIAGQ